MDRKLLDALDNLSLSLEAISEALNKDNGAAKTDVGTAMQSGDFGKQIEEINVGIKSIKDDTTKILDNQETIIKLQKEQKNQKTAEIENAGDRGKKIKDGVTMIVLMAGAILAMGLAFNLIGTVDWKSVLAISIAMPMIAFAFEKIANLKDLKISQMAGMVGITVAMATAITLSSLVLSKVVPIGIYQALTVVFIAAAFGAAAVGLGELLKAFKDIKPSDALKASAVLPIVLLAVSIAIAASSLILSKVVPIGIWQALTVVMISAAFGAVSMGLGKLLSSFKDISPAEATAASLIMPIVLVALSWAIMKSSILLQSVVPIGIWQALTSIVIAATFVALAYVVKPLMDGIKGVDVSDVISGTLILVALTGAIVASSWLIQFMAPVTFSQLFGFVGVGISLAVVSITIALAVRAVNALGTPDRYIEGGVSILILSSTIALSSLILSIGDYKDYPDWRWSLGVGVSLGFFGLGAVLLGTQAANPFFYAGLGVILLVGATIVAISHILSSGVYTKYPSMGWILPVTGILTSFSIMAVAMAIASPLILLGVASILSVVGTISLIDFIFSGGKFNVYPSDKWINAVSGTIKKIAEFAVYIRENIGFSDLLIGSVKILGVAGVIKLTDDILSKGKFEKYPPLNWTDGVVSSILGFMRLMDSKSFLNILSDKIGGVFGGGLEDIAKSIVSVDKILSSGDFNTYPKVAWIDGVSNSLLSFRKIINLLNFDDLAGGGISGKIKSFIGTSNPLKEAVSNITLLAQAFDKLGKAMNSFSSSIQSLDADKLAAIRSLSSNVVLLSLMDPDQFDKMMDKLEDRSSVFNDLIKDFENKKGDVGRSSSIRTSIQSGSNEKSDSQILGDKVDKMTAILADISSVVGSRGTLKSYLNSLKDTQLSGTERSDRRLKNIIKKTGVSDSGINIYLFTYNFDNRTVYQGIIAQELIGTDYESALELDKNGLYSVDYSKIDVEFKKMETY